MYIREAVGGCAKYFIDGNTIREVEGGYLIYYIDGNTIRESVAAVQNISLTEIPSGKP